MSSTLFNKIEGIGQEYYVSIEIYRLKSLLTENYLLDIQFGDESQKTGTARKYCQSQELLEKNRNIFYKQVHERNGQYGQRSRRNNFGNIACCLKTNIKMLK